MGNFKYLFMPLKIGPITVKNRIYMPPHTTAFYNFPAEEPWIRLPSERDAYYFAERAKGGVGLLMYGASSVHPSSDYSPMGCVVAYDERCIPCFKRIADMVHEHDAKIFCQLTHGGYACMNELVRLPMMTPSQIPNPLTWAIPKEMEIEEIKEVEEGFAKSANNLKEAGFDGIEIHAGHGYLIEEFLSPLWNKRTDDYGGSLENRIRLLLEIVDKVRTAIGNKMALGVRIIADQLLQGGFSIDDMKIVSQKLEDGGKIDFLDVDIGTLTSHHIMLGGSYLPPGPATEFIAGIKEVVKKIPVLGCPIRMADPVHAERLLAEGKMDMVGIVRSLIADPEFVNKTMEGRIDDIRPCLFCCEKCLGNFVKALPISCNVNPSVGREKEWGIGTLKPANVVKNIMIIGGGPAGMEAARVATLRGHNVILYEKDRELGGAFRLNCKLPGREEMESIIRWYKIQLKNLGIKIILEKEVTPELVYEVKPDAVVVATGASFLKTGLNGITGATIPGWDQKNVVTPEEVLEGKAEIGDHVIILDDEGHCIAPGIAELLATKGKTVKIITRYPFVGMNLQTELGTFPFVYERILTKGVELIPNSYIMEIPELPGKVIAFNNYTMQTREIETVDTVIMITAKKSRTELYDQLKGKVKELYAIGDCVAPRRIGDAIFEGHKVGRLL